MKKAMWGIYLAGWTANLACAGLDPVILLTILALSLLCESLGGYTRRLRDQRIPKQQPEDSQATTAFVPRRSLQGREGSGGEVTLIGVEKRARRVSPNLTTTHHASQEDSNYPWCSHCHTIHTSTDIHGNARLKGSNSLCRFFNNAA